MIMTIKSIKFVGRSINFIYTFLYIEIRRVLEIMYIK